MVFPLVREFLQGGLVEIGLLRSEGLVVAEAEPVEIGVEECRLIRVVLMEGQQGLV